MYSLLFSKLRGGNLAKVLQILLLVIGFIALLFFVVFPTVDTLIPEDPSING